MRLRLPLVLISGVMIACGTDSTTPPPGSNNTSNLPTPLDSDGDGILDETERLIGTDPDQADSACVQEVYAAGLQSRPIDIIFVIDNSGSMREEIRAIEANINANFAQIMDQASIDYRVIMVTTHGTGNAFDADVCVSSPLSGTNCAPIPTQPANSPRFFHYDGRISSNDSFSRILNTYTRPDPHGLAPGGWSQWLRSDAFKVFIEFTDDNATDMSAERFEAQLLGLTPSQFGTPGSRNYVWHSVVGLFPREPENSAYGPEEPLQAFVCPTAENAGQEYQLLSIVTGGLRYPVCNVETYDAIFQAAAVQIIDDATISCSLRRLKAPEGFRVADGRTALELEAGGTKRTIRQVAGVHACGSDTFYFTEYSIELCPTLCAEVEGLKTGTLSALASCDVQTCDNPQPEICDDEIDNDCNGFIDRQDISCFL